MFDLTFTIDDKGAPTPLTLPIDQAVIAGWTGRDPVARDKHIAELEAIGIARPATTPIYYRVSARRLTMEDSHRGLRREFQRRGRVRADRLAGPHFRRLRLRSHRPQGRGLRRHGLKADVRQADRVGTVGTRRRHRALGPDGPALSCLDRRRARALPGRHARRHAARQGPDRPRFWTQGIARRLRDVRRHLCGQGRHPPGEPVRIRAGRSRAEADDPPWL